MHSLDNSQNVEYILIISASLNYVNVVFAIVSHILMSVLASAFAGKTRHSWS